MDAWQYIERLKAVDVAGVALDTLKSNEAFLIDSNIDQLLHGKTSKGEQIGKYANSGYAAMKYAQNHLAEMGNMDLILTGEFKDGIFINFTADSMIFDSTGKEKEGGVDLLYHYGDDVLGLLMTQDLKETLQFEFIKLFFQ